MKLVLAVHARLPSQRAYTHQVMQMAEAFAQEGASVTLVVARAQPTPAGRDDLWEWYGVRPNFTIESLSIPALISFAARLPKRLQAGWRKMAWGVEWSIFTLKLALWLRNAPRAVVYSRDALPLWGVTRLRPGSAHHCFFEAHTRPSTVIGTRLRRALAKRVGGVVAVTEHLKQHYQRIDAAPANTLAAHDGVRLERFNLEGDRRRWRAQLQWPQNAFIVGYVGQTKTMGEDKGIGLLAQAVAGLAQDRGPDDVRLALVGCSEQEAARYRRQLIARGLTPESLLHPGWIAPSKLPRYLKAFDVCVLPHPWTEFFAYDCSPLKLFEYMASGTPIVATRLPSITEVLSDGENALLVPAGDIQALADALQRLRQDPPLGERLSTQAQRDVQVYSWRVRARRILALIESMQS